MNTFLITTIQLIYVKICMSQFYPNNYQVQFQPNPIPRYYEGQSGVYEERPFGSARRRSIYYRSNEKYDRYDCDSSEECKCSCSKCYDPPPPCREECDACPPEAGGSVDAMPQPGVVFMPVPYLVMVHPNSSTTNGATTEPMTSSTENTTLYVSSTTTTRSTTTSITTTTTTEDPEPVKRMFGSSYSHDNRLIERSYQNFPIMEQRNMKPLRRSKPTWMPKYGIIPIPNRLAENLMSQLKEIKALKRQPRGN